MQGPRMPPQGQAAAQGESSSMFVPHCPSPQPHAGWGQEGGRWERLPWGAEPSPHRGRRLEKQTFMQKRGPAAGLPGHQFWVACGWLSPANASADRRSTDCLLQDRGPGSVRDSPGGVRCNDDVPMAVWGGGCSMKQLRHRGSPSLEDPAVLDRLQEAALSRDQPAQVCGLRHAEPGVSWGPWGLLPPINAKPKPPTLTPWSVDADASSLSAVWARAAHTSLNPLPSRPCPCLPCLRWGVPWVSLHSRSLRLVSRGALSGMAAGAAPS